MVLMSLVRVYLMLKVSWRLLTRLLSAQLVVKVVLARLILLPKTFIWVVILRLMYRERGGAILKVAFGSLEVVMAALAVKTLV